MFAWFIDVRGSLKGRLPLALFKAKCREVYSQWLEAQEEPVAEDAQLKFTNRWVQGWMKEYGVSLQKPNKRFSIKREDRIERIIELIKNVWRARHFIEQKFKKEAVILNGDQMPLHRNESCSQKTMASIDIDTFVKENTSLSRERITVFTQVSTDTANPMPLEFIFKGKGTRVQLHPPPGVHAQWSDSGSYRQEHILTTISHLKRRAFLSESDTAIYLLDNYSVHVTPETQMALRNRGYIPIFFGGGITGDLQVNDTHIHHRLKAAYRQLESELMLEKLRAEPNKVPAPTRDEMMSLCQEAWQNTKVDINAAMKQNFLTNKFDGSEDHLVSDRLYKLVGQELVKFREELVKSAHPENIKALMRTITPPKGVSTRLKAVPTPPDEGAELFDCEGEQLDVNQQGADEAIEGESSTVAAALPKEQLPRDVVSLTTLTSDPAFRADSQLLDGLHTLLSEYEKCGTGSVLFTPFVNGIRSLQSKARKSLKKRLATNYELTESLSSNAIQSQTTESATAEPATAPTKPQTAEPATAPVEAQTAEPATAPVEAQTAEPATALAQPAKSKM